MRRALLFLPIAAWVPLVVEDCGGGSSVPDASMDATTMDVAPDVDAADASVDVAIDVPPVRAIWVSTPTTLFNFDPVARTVTRVAHFGCSGEPMVDLAMNAQEQLFGVTTESVVAIDKVTGACTEIARGAQNLPYGTGFVPATSLEAGVETWLGYVFTTYDAIDPDSGALTFEGNLGFKAGNFQASGDMVAIAGGNTYLTGMGLDPMEGDGVIQVDPNTGAATKLLGVTGVPALVGLAQWAGILYAFDVNGNIYRIQLLGDAGIAVQLLAVSYDFGDASTPDAMAPDAGDAGDAAMEAAASLLPLSFRGAAVTTRAPSQ